MNELEELLTEHPELNICNLRVEDLSEEEQLCLLENILIMLFG